MTEVAEFSSAVMPVCFHFFFLTSARGIAGPSIVKAVTWTTFALIFHWFKEYIQLLGGKFKH